MGRFSRTTAWSFGLALALGAGACARAAAPREVRGTEAPAAAPSDEMGAPAIDEALRAAWKEAGVEPSERADDARFLRRAWLDLAGIVPPADEVTRFLADASPDKRHAAVGRILAGPRWAEH